MNILHLNVRLNEGGAAVVALDLSRRLNELKGYESRVSYGYSKGAKPNAKEQSLNAQHIGSRGQVVINYGLYKILNYDLLPPIGSHKQDLLNNIEWADVIHLHVVHSFFISLPWLVDALIKSKKKIVWTLHDYWILTGRCAITDTCTKWKSLCGSCPTLGNYPEVWVDRSGTEAIRKRKLINRLINEGCKFISPSMHLKNDVKLIYPDMNITIINNSLDMETEWLVNNMAPSKKRSDQKIRIIIIAHDLQYEGKTNINFINNIIKLNNIELHTVGKNSPFYGEAVVNHGYISAKNKLYDLYQEMSFMLFTSQVDNFPLVIGEALSVGIPVVATHSSAALEVLSLVDASPGSFEEIINAIIDQSWIEKFYSNQSISDFQTKALNAFSGQRLISEHAAIYG